MNRRRFLHTAGASAAAAAIGAPAIHAFDKAGAKPAIVGAEGFRYECDHNWGTLPSHVEWQTTHGTAVDAEGLVYITHRVTGKMQMDTVVVFDAQGKYVRSFGKQWTGGGHGIDIRKEGSQEFLYLCNTTPGGPVVKTTLKGEIVWSKGVPEECGLYKIDPAKTDPKTGKPIEPLYKPTNIAFAPDGGFYVADGYGSHYIHQYDKDDKWVRSWGGFGTEAGKMQTPHGLWLDDRPGRTPSLVVADRANARLQYFTLDGKHIGFVNDLSFPAHFDIRGDVLLVPDLHARITLLDKNNKVITHLGFDPEWTKKALADKFKMREEPNTWQAGKFVHPHDACFDHDGNIFVAEWVAGGRVSKLKKVG